MSKRDFIDFSLEDTTLFDKIIDALSEPFTVAFILLFGVGAPVMGYIIKQLE
ncbi:MAG: hypothetical protein ACTSPB_20140 [Candidatus Thorarchaeota archaeon]